MIQTTEKEVTEVNGKEFSMIRIGMLFIQYMDLVCVVNKECNAKQDLKIYLLKSMQFFFIPEAK